ncbi:MAG: GspH/FimT family pseudopilin [Pseudomonadota bacterium]
MPCALAQRKGALHGAAGAPARRPGAGGPAGQRGFSLIEIMAVLVIIGLLVGVVGASLYRNLDSVKVRRAGSDIMTALRYARGQAIVTHDVAFLEVDIEQRSLTAHDREPWVLPDGVEITVRTAAMDILSDSRGRIRFYPDGSSTGGTITLTAGEREWYVDVAWLTGEIRLSSSAGDAS